MWMLELNGLPYPPSNNKRMKPGFRRLRLTDEQRQYKIDLKEFLENEYPQLSAREAKNRELFVDITYIGGPLAWYTKKGAIRKVDVDNRHKSLIDVVFEHLGLDDSQAFGVLTRKKTIRSDGAIEVDVILSFIQCEN